MLSLGLKPLAHGCFARCSLRALAKTCGGFDLTGGLADGPARSAQWQSVSTSFVSTSGIRNSAVSLTAEDTPSVAERQDRPEHEESWADTIPKSEARHVLIEDGFLERAQPGLAVDLRKAFEARFEDPLKTTGERFCWDYWHVPDQYTLLRTPADAFFSEQQHEALVQALLSHGEARLGCRGISPVWLSYYIDGCQQELHTDNPHGPWAFVLSLTPWATRKFRGGETLILPPTLLDGSYWASIDVSRGQELRSLVRLVEPEFDRMTIFDPRLPHGVRRVAGVADPCEARLVLHGWFTDPQPFAEGGLDGEALEGPLNAALAGLFQELETLPGARGVLVVRATVAGTDGSVTGLEWLTDTVVVPGAVPLPEDPKEDAALAVRGLLQSLVAQHLRDAAFPACAEGDTLITIPIMFQ